MQRKGRTEQLSLGNGKVMEFKLIKHGDASKDLAGQLNEFFSARTIEQHAYKTPWMEQGILKRLNDRTACLQNAVGVALNTAKQRMIFSKVKLIWISKQK